MSKKKLINIILLCIFVVSITGCSCTYSDYFENDTYITGDFSKINKDYIRDSGLVIGKYVVELPSLVCELPFNSNTNFYFVADNKSVISDSRIKPYQIIQYSSSDAITTSGMIKDGVYYAYNDKESDNLPDYCRVFAIYLSMNALSDDDYLQIGQDRINNKTSYSEACSIFRNNVTSPEYFCENLTDSRGPYSVAYYNDILYRIGEKLSTNSVDIVIRIDKDINDAGILNDIPWRYY